MSLLNYEIQETKNREKFWIAREFFLEPGVLKASPHGLRRGTVDDYYFDFDYLLNDPYKCEFIIGIYADLITKIIEQVPIDLLAFVEKASGGTVGAIRLSAALSMKTNLPNIIVRPKKSITFEQIKVPFGAAGERDIATGLEGYRTIVVTDHCTSGTEALLAAQILRRHKALVQHVVAYTVRWDLFKDHEQKYNQSNLTLNYAYGLPAESRPTNLSELDAISVNF